MRNTRKISRRVAISATLVLVLTLLGFSVPSGIAAETTAPAGTAVNQEARNVTPVGTVDNLPRWRSLAKNDNKAMPENPGWEPAFGAGSYNFTAEHEDVQLPEGQGGWGWDKASHTFTFRNFDDTNYLVQKPEDEVTGKKYRATGLVINARMLAKDQPLTIRFEGVNNLGATAGSDGIKPIYVLAGEGDVIIEGAPGAVLNLNPRPFWNDSGKLRCDLYGIYVDQIKTKSGQLQLTSGTVNITGKFTKKEIEAKDLVNSGHRFTGIDSGKDVLVKGSTALSVKLDSADPSVSGAMSVYLDREYVGAERIDFDTTGPVELDSSDGWPTVYGASYYSGKGPVKHTSHSGRVYTGAQHDLYENDDTYIGVISPVNAKQVEARAPWSIFQAENGSAIKDTATVAAVYAVKTQVENPDEATTEVTDDDGNPVTEVIADKHLTIKHKVGDTAYDLAKALKREDQAIAPGATVTLKAPSAPAGYMLNWELVGVDEDELAGLYATMGVSAEDLEKATLAYVQPERHVTWQVTYAKKPEPKPEPTPEAKPEPKQVGKDLPKTGAAGISTAVLLGALSALAGTMALRMRKH